MSSIKVGCPGGENDSNDDGRKFGGVAVTLAGALVSLVEKRGEEKIEAAINIGLRGLLIEGSTVFEFLGHLA